MGLIRLEFIHGRQRIGFMSTMVASGSPENKPKLLRSVRDHGFYIGYPSNLRRRFRQHSEGNSLATSHRGPWKLIYYEAYLEQADAPGREKYFKSGAGRRFLRSQLKNYLRKHPSKEAA